MTILSRRPRGRLLSIMSIVAIAAGSSTGCGGDSKPSGAADPANLVPASASAYLAITVRPEGQTKANAERVAKALLGTDALGQAALELLGTKAGGLRGLSFEKDVDPWLGNRVAVALTANDASENDLLLVAASRDDDKARDALEKSARLPGEATFREVDYRRAANGSAAGAVLKGAVVLGSERAVQGAIAAVADDSVLGGAARYSAAIGELPPEGVATAYLDVSAVAEAIGGLLGGGETARLLKPVLSAQGDVIAARVSAGRDEIRIEAVGTGTGAGIAAVQAQGGASHAIRTLPADSWLALGISDVGKTVGVLLDGVASAGGLDAIGLNLVLSQIESSTGLNLRDDVLAWMGAGGLFVRGTRSGEVSGALVVRSKDPAATRRALRKLRRSLDGLPGGARPRPLAAAGADEGVVLTLGDLRLELAAAGERFVIAVGKGALAAAINPKAELKDAPGFKRAEQRLGDDLNAGFYVDLPQVADLIDRSGGGQDGASLLAGVLRRMTQVAGGGKQDGDVSRVRIVAGVKQP